MAKAPRVGRDSIFRGKAGGKRIQGIITKTGASEFARHRRELHALYTEVTGTAPNSVSEADVIEFMARGADGTRKYLEKGRK